eukprot:TRINITY_DN35536_c0_g1_i1.p1 TRINITY_DN35536_c0_g1~~TRINITY_DN35536_c0_g1_i1.p1  ORF type:complete len:101 (-),score=15.02 TRINITY_DN35536_c0_g1_i1:130-432(-)
MPMRSGRDIQPQHPTMTGPSQPNSTLKQLVKNMQEMMTKNIEDIKVHATTMQQQSQAQCLENIERSHQDDNGHHYDRNRNHERIGGHERNRGHKQHRRKE